MTAYWLVVYACQQLRPGKRVMCQDGGSLSPGRECCVCPHRGGRLLPPPAEPAAGHAGTALCSGLFADTQSARTLTVSTTAAHSSCEHHITSQACSSSDCAGTGPRCGTPFCTLGGMDCLSTSCSISWPCSGDLGLSDAQLQRSGTLLLLPKGMHTDCAKDSCSIEKLLIDC